MAVVRWGQPRYTEDVDVSLLTGLGDEQKYINRLLGSFSPRVDDAAEFALVSRVLLLSSSQNTPIDVALAAFPFEEQIIDRASPFPFAKGVDLLTASAEDLVLLKAVAGREQDWADIRGVIVRQGSALDWSYITRELAGLQELATDGDVVSHLDRIRHEVQSAE